MSLFLASQIPPGTGLGSSSSVAVGIIKAVGTALDVPMDRAAIAERACSIEIDKLGAPIGKQDQYATAFGGLNWIEFARDGVRVEPLRLPGDTRARLERNLMLFYTGSTRSASQILQETTRLSRAGEPAVLEALHSVQAMAVRIRAVLLEGDLEAFGRLLHETWEQKKRYARSVTNPAIDEAYALARRAGALGGKIAGAGGGGFLMLYAEPERHEAVTRALDSRGIRRMDYHFETHGAQVLLNSGVALPRAGRECVAVGAR
jgi:D-glycero-alpha-D-manno-heptose-7-phosphate kinase